MQEIECLKQPDHVCQPSQDNHDMQYLMTASEYVVLPRIPSFRNLQHAVSTVRQTDC